MNVLEELGVRYGTDKAGHGYLPFYDSIFGEIRHSRVSLLEIGVLRGASLRMWRDYFPNGSIYGIDKEECYAVDEKRIKCFVGRQGSRRFLREVVEQVASLDIVIDDGSHRGKDSLVSFIELWPHIQPGGWYVVEDALMMFKHRYTPPGTKTVMTYLSERYQQFFWQKTDVQEIHLMTFVEKGVLVAIKKSIDTSLKCLTED